jgi:hypothetical protein
VVPDLAEQTEVRFRLAPEGNEPIPDMKGVVVDLETTADFEMLAQRVYRSFDESTPQQVLASIEPNLMPIENQIQALEEAGNVLVHGDQPEHGYSLRRTILAHGTELDPKSEHFFELDIYKMSSIPEALKEKRFQYILGKFPLDEAQRAKHSISRHRRSAWASTSFKASQALARHACARHYSFPCPYLLEPPSHAGCIRRTNS